MVLTAVVNGLGALLFVPAAMALRQFAGLSVHAHPFYLAVIGSFILIFGCAYLWVGITGRADALFLSVAAAGKLAFFTLTVVYWVLGDLPAEVPLAASSDLILALTFFSWLVVARHHGAAARSG